MKFFLDTANIEEIKEIAAMGLCDGVTTNPTLIGKAGRDFEETIKEIASIVEGPVSAEVTAKTAEGMVEEARVIAKWAENVVVKIPMGKEGLKAIKVLSSEGIKTNCTLIFSVSQGLLAAKAGATYISPFIGRIDDLAFDGMDLIENLRIVLDNYGFKTEIIAASVRTIAHVEQSALVGADIATIPSNIFSSLWKHLLTDVGIARFDKDWEDYQNSLK
ncbi:fructose-6-phosphate aldolase [Peptoniphilaceae bacterium SGI.131]